MPADASDFCAGESLLSRRQPQAELLLESVEEGRAGGVGRSAGRVAASPIVPGVSGAAGPGAVAVIAGFLLTAVRNWTNTPTPSGLPLAGMGALWLIARILPILVAIFPRWLIAAADLAFLPTFAIGIAVPLLKNNEKQNLIFLPLLAVLWSADLLVHADVLCRKA